MMTLEQVRDKLRSYVVTRLLYNDHAKAMADAIDAHLTSREAKVDDLYRRCGRCHGEGIADVYVGSTGGSFMEPPDPVFERDACPDCDGAGFTPAAQEAAKPNEWQKAIIEQAMVTECVSIEGRDPLDILRDIISWHVELNKEAADTCGRCGASNSLDAESRCVPDGDSCPGCEEPLASKWEAAKPVVPDGWVLVPVEPTEQIEQAAADYLDAPVKAYGLWKAMIAAVQEGKP